MNKKSSLTIEGRFPTDQMPESHVVLSFTLIESLLNRCNLAFGPRREALL